MSQAYTNYIEEHRRNVMYAYLWLVNHGLVDVDIVSETAVIIASHDRSKYQAEEYDAYDKYFYGQKTPEVEKEFNYAWLHHIHSNPHHWQYWVLKHDDEPEEALEMPRKYVYEMIADWWSFSHKTGDLTEIFGWYEKHKGMVLHPNTRKLVEDTLKKIKEILDSESNK